MPISIDRYLKDKNDFLGNLDTKNSDQYARDYVNLLLGSFLEFIKEEDYEKAVQATQNMVRNLYEKENDDGTLKTWRNGNH